MDKTSSCEIQAVANCEERSPGDLSRNRDIVILSLKQPIMTYALAFAALAIASIGGIAAQGFIFGVNNNIFHIPIVLRLDELPQFQNDPFYQSLKNFVVGLWPLLRIFVNEQSVETWFFLLHWLSRWILSIGIFLLARTLGVTSIWVQICVATLFIFSLTLLNFSPIGKHDLLVDYFTHSELATALAITSLALYASARPLAAWVLVGIIANINLFVAAWVGIAFVIVTVWELHGAENKLYKLWQSIIMGTVSLIIGSPTILWTLKVILTTKAQQDFNLQDFIRIYYPNHVLIESAAIDDALTLTVAIFLGFRAIVAAGHEGLKKLLLSLLIIFGGGLAAPYLTDSKLILTIFQLRVDGLIFLLCAGIIIAISLEAFLRKESKAIVVSGAAVTLAGMIGGNWMGPLVGQIAGAGHSSKRLSWMLMTILISTIPLALLLGGSNKTSLVPSIAASTAAFAISLAVLSRVWQPLLTIAALGLLEVFVLKADFGIRSGFYLFAIALILSLFPALSMRINPMADTVRPMVILGLALSVVLVWGISIFTGYSHSSLQPHQKALRELAAYVRPNLKGTFLIPISIPGIDKEASGQFQMFARQPSWVGFKEGAAVGWSPSYYHHWYPRYIELEAQKTLDDHIHLACREDIPYLVWNLEEIDEVSKGSVIYRNNILSIIETHALCAGLK